MITEDFVSFETAKLLKEKNCPDFGYSCIYDSEGNKAQTQSIIMKWLREVYGLFISIGNDDLDYNWQIFDVKNRTKGLDPICLTDSYGGYRKYELACELAIKYCLKNLIK